MWWMSKFNGKEIDAGISSVKGNNYRIEFWYMSKDEAISLFKKCWFKEKKWNIKRYKYSVTCLIHESRNRTSGDNKHE